MLLRIQLVKSLISFVQMQSVYYSSGLSTEQLIRLRAEQKELYGGIIRGNTEQSSKRRRKKEEKEEEIKEKESIVSRTADFKAFTCESKACEFYWLIQRDGNRNVRILRSEDVEVDKDLSTSDKFDESSNKTS